jgi:CHAT domain
MKILILESNPKKDLNLTKEIKDLQGMIERSRDREQFQVELGLAVNTGELQGLLLKHEPQIVHFCGHGTGEQGLVLQDESGREQFVATDALKNFFELFSERVECVLLNACYSEVQADAIVEHINYVIGMSQAILDSAAIAFSKGFYQALGYGKTIEQAYKFGCNQIHLTVSNAGNAVHRSAVSEEERKLNVVDVIGQSVERINIPEYLKPQLRGCLKSTGIAQCGVKEALIP